MPRRKLSRDHDTNSIKLDGVGMLRLLQALHKAPAMPASSCPDPSGANALRALSFPSPVLIQLLLTSVCCHCVYRTFTTAQKYRLLCLVAVPTQSEFDLLFGILHCYRLYHSPYCVWIFSFIVRSSSPSGS